MKTRECDIPDGQQADRFFSREGFVALAAIGAAVGLGNLWRFPFVAFENGGGSFLIPYCLVTVIIGLPFVVFEFAIGRHFGGSIVSSIMGHIGRHRWMGWAIGLNCFIIATYYVVILAWALIYLLGAFSLEWAHDPQGYFNGEVLGLSDSVWNVGPPRMKLIAALAAIWAAIFWITSGRLKRVERVLRFTVALPFLALLVILVRAVTLPGAMDGVRRFIQPDYGQLMRLETWGAALTQVMLSLSIGMGQLVAYSSRGRAKHIAKGATLTVLGNAGFSLIAGVTVFAIMGYWVHQGAQWEQVQGGPGLTFVAYPAAIAMLPTGAAAFGVLFFVMLILLGIDSAFAVIEANLLPVQEIAGGDRRRISGSLCVVGFVIGIFFTTSAGMHWLFITDHIVAHYGILIAVLVESIVFGWCGGGIRVLCERAGVPRSLRAIWGLGVRVVAPVASGVIIIASLKQDLTTPYSGYPASAMFLAMCAIGVSIAVGTAWLSLQASRRDSARKTMGTRERDNREGFNDAAAHVATNEDPGARHSTTPD